MWCECPSGTLVLLPSPAGTIRLGIACGIFSKLAGGRARGRFDPFGTPAGHGGRAGRTAPYVISRSTTGPLSIRRFSSSVFFRLSLRTPPICFLSAFGDFQLLSSARQVRDLPDGATGCERICTRSQIDANHAVSGRYRFFPGDRFVNRATSTLG